MESKISHEQSTGPKQDQNHMQKYNWSF